MATLTPEFLRAAYAEGYFPMPHPETGEILWFDPDPRAIFPLEKFHISHSLARTLRRGTFRVTFDTCFRKIMEACADRPETWITKEFIDVYTALHRAGHAHSIEVWRGEKLAGGVYGVSLGAAFFAESKFHRDRDASKVALFHLVERMKARGFQLLEVQFLTPHLESLGATAVSRRRYHGLLRAALRFSPRFT